MPFTKCIGSHLPDTITRVEAMDILTRDSQKLALLKEDIMLLPNSLKVQDFLPDPPLSMRATHQLELVMKYALAEVKPLDFTILPPALLPTASILDLV